MLDPSPSPPSKNSQGSLLAHLEVHQPSPLQEKSTETTPQRLAVSMVPLVQVTIGGQLDLNYSYLQLVRKYVEQDLMFCGVVRSKGPRSPFLEDLFELTKNRQEQQLENNKHETKGCPKNMISIGKRPISIGLHKKVFLLEYILPERDSETYSQIQQQKMIDLLVSLCHSVMLQNESSINQFMPVAKNSALRLQLFEGTSLIWPGTVYLLKANSNEIDELSKEFIRAVNLSHSKQKQILQKEFINDLRSNNIPKRHQKLQLDGFVINEMMNKLIQLLNISKNVSDRIKLAEILDEIQQKIYEECYKKLTQIYDKLACKYFVQNEPYPMEYLLECFMKVKTQTLLQFNFNKNYFNDSVDKWMNKLDDYIGQKQRLVIEVNKKKGYSKMKNFLQSIQVGQQEVRKPNKLSQLFQSARKMGEKYDQGTAELISSCFASKIDTIISKRQKKLRYRGKQYKEERQKELASLVLKRACETEQLREERINTLSTNEVRKQQKKEFAIKAESISKTRKKLKISIKEENYIIEKLQQQEKATQKQRQEKKHKLMPILAELQKAHKEDLQQLRQIQEQQQFDPEKERLERQLQALTIKRWMYYEQYKSILGGTVSSKDLITTNSREETSSHHAGTSTNRAPTEQAVNVTFSQKP